MGFVYLSICPFGDLIMGNRGIGKMGVSLGVGVGVDLSICPFVQLVIWCVLYGESINFNKILVSSSVPENSGIYRELAIRGLVCG